MPMPMPTAPGARPYRTSRRRKLPALTMGSVKTPRGVSNGAARASLPTSLAAKAPKNQAGVTRRYFSRSRRSAAY